LLQLKNPEKSRVSPDEYGASETGQHRSGYGGKV
jgi:hypothetical protein